LWLTLLAPAPAENPVPKGLEKLQGVWKITTMESRGTSQPAAVLPAADRYTLVIVGNAYVLRTHAGTLAIDLEKKTADLTITEGRYQGQTLPGLFELKGDTLKLAFPTPGAFPRGGNGQQRPRELKTGPDSTHLLYTFERDKAATKEQAEAKLKELKESLAAPAAGGFGGRTTATDRATQQLLRQILDKLDRIEKRLDEMEKKGKDK
jgi:uncharacterized protein (TIGR03067 family)